MPTVVSVETEYRVLRPAVKREERRKTMKGIISISREVEALEGLRDEIYNEARLHRRWMEKYDKEEDRERCKAYIDVLEHLIRVYEQMSDL